MVTAFVRTILLYFIIMLGLRLMGKRQLGELQPEELVSTILISNLASISIESEEVPVTASLIPLFLIAALELLKTTQTNATIPFVLDGQVLEDNLHWCGKNHAWLERTAEANTVLISEILLLVGNETEDYFLLKKESRHSGSSRKKDA